jgi:CheY-like chemotaxis protein
MMSLMSKRCFANNSGATCAVKVHDRVCATAPIALQRITDAAGVSLILILSDVNMPGMSGLDLLPKTKVLRPDVPVIMITAYGDAETKCKAMEGSAEALLTKPIYFGNAPL